MRTRTRFAFGHAEVGVVLSWVVATSQTVVAQARFQELGTSSPGLSGAAYAVSADGTTVAGVDFGEPFRWRRDTGMVGLGVLDESPCSSGVALGVSGDGNVIAGYENINHDPFCAPFFRRQSVWWTPKSGLAYLDSRSSIALDVSADGSVIVGSIRADSYDRAFRWSRTDGFFILPMDFFRSYAAAVSGDGSTIVGGYNPDGRFYRAFKWSPEEGFMDLGDFDGGAASASAAGVSHDGTIVVGGSDRADPENPTHSATEAFSWTAEGGLVGLGDLPGGSFSSAANAISGDGRIVVGWSSVGPAEAYDYAAFIIELGSPVGMRDLRSVLAEEHGLDLTGWRLRYPNGISHDGRVVAGDGFNPEGRLRPWFAYLGRTCIADWNDDSVVNSQDLFDYLRCLFAPYPPADPNTDPDMNNDDRADSIDFFIYLDVFFDGCP